MSEPLRGTPVVTWRTSVSPYGFASDDWWNGWAWTSAPHAVSQLVDPPAEEPLTLDEAKLRAGLVWAPGDERDALMTGFIKAARGKVELDTGLALLTQTRTVYVDAVPVPLELPGQCSPLQTIDEVKIRLADRTTSLVDPATYVFDPVSNPARIMFLSTGTGVPSNVSALQPLMITLTAGWSSAAVLKEAAPLLVHAVGVLAAHYMTLGRDLVSIGAGVDELPFGYEHAIAGYRPARVG